MDILSNSQCSANIFSCDRGYNEAFIPSKTETVCVCVTVMSLAFFRRLLLSVSPLLSLHLVILEEGGREGGRENDERTSCVSKDEKKGRGIGYFLKIQSSQSERKDGAGGSHKKREELTKIKERSREKLE